MIAQANETMIAAANRVSLYNDDENARDEAIERANYYRRMERAEKDRKRALQADYFEEKAKRSEEKAKRSEDKAKRSEDKAKRAEEEIKRLRALIEAHGIEVSKNDY